MFLSPDELVTLTGYRRPSRQIVWLRARRVRHFVNAVGHPVVARATVEGRDQAPQAVRPRLHLVAGKA